MYRNRKGEGRKRDHDKDNKEQNLSQNGKIKAIQSKAYFLFLFLQSVVLGTGTELSKR